MVAVSAILAPNPTRAKGRCPLPPRPSLRPYRRLSIPVQFPPPASPYLSNRPKNALLASLPPPSCHVPPPSHHVPSTSRHVPATSRHVPPTSRHVPSTSRPRPFYLTVTSLRRPRPRGTSPSESTRDRRVIDREKREERELAQVFFRRALEPDPGHEMGGGVRKREGRTKKRRER